MGTKIIEKAKRKKEIADLDRDIAIVQARLESTQDFETQLAYRKLLKLLNIWKRRGY